VSLRPYVIFPYKVIYLVLIVGQNLSMAALLAAAGVATPAEMADSAIADAVLIARRERTVALVVVTKKELAEAEDAVAKIKALRAMI
jgi:hypothetical protein